MTSLRIATVLAAATLFLAAFAAHGTSSYDALVSSAMSDPAHADFDALRAAYPASPLYDPDNLGTRATFEAMWKAYDAGDCPTVLTQSGEVLKLNFTYIAAHTVRALCLKKGGDDPGAKNEMLIARGLANSILASGDGKTDDTAYVIVTLDEENFVLAHLGLTEERQALLSAGGHSFDAIDGTYKATGAKGSVLFRIDAMIVGESHLLNAKH